MSQTYTLKTNEMVNQSSTGLGKRVLVLLYGATGYLAGMISLLWFILAMGGLAPSGFSPLETSTLASSLLVNIGLIVLFGLQHSIMARPGFKRLLRKTMPAATERSTFLLFSGIVLSLAIWAWQPLPGHVWYVENTMGLVTLYALYALGWSYLLVASFVTNHFELMGLRQIYLYFTGKPYTKISFTQKYMYKYSRHPMMLGFLVGMWCVPVMTYSQFVMAFLFSLYVFTGIYFEERDLMSEFGDTYKKYKKEIATLIPKLY
jgi:protein-S-isoprenylcysteine O-methyltransferase Ste14